MTVVAPPVVLAPLPVLLTARFQTAVCPWVKFPECDLEMLRVGAVTTVMKSVFELTGVVLPLPETEAVFDREAGALEATFTLSVSVGNEVEAPTNSALVQVIV